MPDVRFSPIMNIYLLLGTVYVVPYPFLLGQLTHQGNETTCITLRKEIFEYLAACAFMMI